MKGSGVGRVLSNLAACVKDNSCVAITAKIVHTLPAEPFCLLDLGILKEDCVNEIRSLLGMSQLSLIAMHLVQ